MQVKRRSSMTQVLAGLAVAILALVVVALNPETAVRSTGPTPPAGAGAGPMAGRSIGSMFQDDQHLIYAQTSTVTRTLDVLKGLGVNQIRATVVWKALAPDALSRSAPRNFSATRPSAYPAKLWLPYDRLDELARARGMTVNFNVTDPGPLWAMGDGASAHYADHWMPSPTDFGRFVQALGTRYSGRYVPPGAHAPLPRVNFWSIWNEPNQPGWLAPQWHSSSAGPVMVAPVLYRGYVDAGFGALVKTGHGPSTDTVLIGDLAPEGCAPGVSCPYPRPEWATPPLPFLRALYCVGPDLRLLRGSAASAIGCPARPDPRAFVSTHPGLFEPTGFAHHPYSLFLAPNVSMTARSEAGFVPLSDLGRLEHSLDAILRTYAVKRRLPIYLTEYGYITNPPNPVRGVSPQTQALYLDQAEYMAWRDPRVRTLSQFLLYDPPPRPQLFQTALLYANGRPKPSLQAYRLPIFLPHPALGADHRVAVWAMLRAASPNSLQRVDIQWQGDMTGQGFRTLQSVVVDDRAEVLSATVGVPGPGVLRIRWRSPSGEVQYSRAAAVRSG